MARVLLTGATGVLGRHVHRVLETLGHDVTAMSRRPLPGSGWIRADLVTGDGFASLPRKMDAVIHSASDSGRPADTDLRGVRRLRELYPDARIVYPSIVGIDKVGFPYYKHKRAVEQEVAAGEHVILRLTQFHEFPHQVANRPMPVMPLGFRTQPISAREAAELLAKCVEGPRGRRPDAGGPHVHELRTLVGRVVKAQGRNVSIRRVPTRGLLGFLRGANLCPDRNVGRQSWDEHFQDWKQAGMPNLVS